MKKTFKRMKRREQIAPSECYFCKEKKMPLYNDIAVLSRFITERGRIISQSRNGVCAKHQRRLSDAIKYARFLAFMPFVIRE